MSTMQVGHEAPDFQLSDLNGETVRLSEMRGTGVVLNFFHTGCTWCRAMIPQLDAVYDRLENIEIPILGIAVGEDTTDSVRAFAKEHDINIFLGVDSDRSIRQSYGLERVPTVVLVDSDGFVARVYTGSSEQLPGIVHQAVMSLAGGDETPNFAHIGNGCAP